MVSDLPLIGHDNFVRFFSEYFFQFVNFFMLIFYLFIYFLFLLFLLFFLIGSDGPPYKFIQFEDKYTILLVISAYH